MLIAAIVICFALMLWSSKRANQEEDSIKDSETQAEAVERTVNANLWIILAALFGVFILLSIGVSSLPHG